jgi:hypothetical protein
MQRPALVFFSEETDIQAETGSAGDFRLPKSVSIFLTSVRTMSANMKSIVRAPNPPTKIECKFTIVVLARAEVIASIVAVPPTTNNMILTAIASFSRSISRPLL